MSVTHVNNLYEAIVFLAENQKNQSEIYNVTDPHITTLQEVYELLRIKYHKRVILHVPKSLLQIGLPLNSNIFSYIKDIFCREKVLDAQKIASLGFNSKHFDIARVIEEEY